MKRPPPSNQNNSYLLVLSGWMANFGVEPLLLLKAFLFLPLWTFFLARLFSDTFVRDTILFLLLLQTSLLLLSKSYLGNEKSSIKTPTLLRIWCFWQILISTTTMAAEPELITLRVGEHLHLKVAKISHFTISNKAVISHKALSNSLLIKGKNAGETEVLIWNRQKKQHLWRIVVAPMASGEAILPALIALKNTSLQIVPQGPYLISRGELHRWEDYKIFYHVWKANPQAFITQHQLSPQLKKDLISKIYQEFYREQVNDFFCLPQNWEIICEYDPSTPVGEKTLDALKEQINLRTVPNEEKNYHRNFLLRLKLVQLEDQAGSSQKLGIQQFNIPWDTLWSGNWARAIGPEILQLTQQKIRFSVLAEPEIILRPGQMGKIQVGQEIPYQNKKLITGAQMQWKFVGLTVNVEIIPQGESFLLKYQTSFGQGQGAEHSNQFSKNLEEGQALIQLDHSLQIFQIGLVATKDHKQQIPLLGELPGIGHFFQSKEQNKSYQYLVGVIRLEAIPIRE